GDAVVEVGEAKMGGLSTYASLFILNSILICGAKKALERGVAPPIYTSGNIEGGTAKNIALEERYFGRVKRL
ncbi:MAG: sugar isomerase, partial [Kiritimatiellae bacterium]|nr:sugar isomerase [Kiritimatiellia bacterium]